jgi:hypothetical protein
MGPTIDIFINFDGGHCWNCQRTPRRHTIDNLLNYDGGHYQNSRQHPPRGPTIDVWLNLVPVASIFLVTPSRGHYGKHYYYEQDKYSQKNIFEALRC